MSVVTILIDKYRRKTVSVGIMNLYQHINKGFADISHGHILRDRELRAESVIRKLRITAPDGKTYTAKLLHYPGKADERLYGLGTRFFAAVRTGIRIFTIFGGSFPLTGKGEKRITRETGYKKLHRPEWESNIAARQGKSITSPQGGSPSRPGKDSIWK